MAKKPKRPKDGNQLAKLIADLATNQTETQPEPVDEIKAAAALLGRKGGLKGGKARAKALTAKERKAIAEKAAAKRWGKKK